MPMAFGQVQPFKSHRVCDLITKQKKKVSKRVASMGKYVYGRKVQILMSLGVERS